MTSRRTSVALATVLVAVLVAAVVAVAWSLREGRAEPTAQARSSSSTTRITRQTLSTVASVSGQLSHGPTSPIVSRQAGTLTWLPEIGSVLTRGEELLRADEQPVVLLYGAIPMYRALIVGAEGRDIAQFETNLRDLGYVGFTVDEKFTERTAQAVKRWQHSLGQPETGTVGIGQVIYLPGEVRVAEHLVLPGADAATQVMNYSGTRRIVTADVSVVDAGWAVAGRGVRVTLPNGRAVAGTVSDVGTVTGGDQSGDQSGGGSGDQSGGQTSSGGGSATVHVTITIPDQRALGALQAGAVGVQYTLDRRVDVLAVPVSALLALAEGGYGLEVIDGARSRVVAVETGLVANGQIEVRGQGIRAGQTVGFAG